MSSRPAKQSLDPRNLIDEKQIAFGILGVLAMWSDDRYRQYLRGSGSKILDLDWFKGFTAEWNVARSLDKNQIQTTVSLLNRELPKKIKTDTTGAAVDEIACLLQVRGVSAKGSNKVTRVVPISLVSKVAFLFDPDTYVPLDRFGKKGLNKIRGAAQGGGLGQSKFSTYVEYFAAFEQYFTMVEKSIRREIKKDWVDAVAKQFSIPATATRSKAFRRKVFDHILMDLGGR